MSALANLISVIEDTLASYYYFSRLTGASSHVITRSEILDAIGDRVVSLPEWDARASVWVSQDHQNIDDLFIGLHINEELQKNLAEFNPLNGLCDNNLDAFCVLVEELSHFHLIINRAAADRQVSKLELEWQGEVDKLLVCALLLQKQAGDPHVLPLMRRLFDNASIVSACDRSRYAEATRLAARFWCIFARDTSFLSGPVRLILNQAYRATWQEKIASIWGLEVEKAS